MNIAQPFFKPDRVLQASIDLGKAVTVFLDEYDALMDSPASLSRGADVAKVMNKLNEALVLWGIETNQQIQSGNVDKVIEEHNNTEGKQ